MRYTCYYNRNIIILSKVGSHVFAEMGVKALEQTQYGGLSVKLASSVEEAIRFCREQIGAQI